HHPNVVPILEVGASQVGYFLVMEYIEGDTLARLLARSASNGKRLPVSIALRIAIDMLSGLHAAHELHDDSNEPVNLVHRDVSPQNVLLSLEGDVKLCDFGIAKAVSKAGQTQMGALKGKLQYMSPEQAWGRQVDARSDIFSLGSVLFEMLTGERLFSGDTEMSVLESVRHGQIRSTRQIDPSIPPGVDEIVAKALAYDPQNRFANAGEMKVRLEALLHTLSLSPDPTDLAAWVQRVLEEEPSSGDWSVAPAISAIAEAPSRPVFEEPPMPEPAPPEVYAPVPPLPRSAPPVHPALPADTDIEPRPAVAAVAPIGEVRVGESASRSRNVLYLAIAALVLIAIVTLFLVLRRSGQQPPAGEASTPRSAAPALRTAPPVPSPVPAATPAPAAAAPALSQEQIQKMIEEGTAKQEQEIRRKLDAQERRLRDEIARVQAETRKKKEAADAAANEGEPTPPPR
ncbi:MAG TPA: protein kinase, partial [Thermoanaerobaculia bacterium]|nr:protein kinase [Thermoanaerobaculia bacterium]